MSKITIEAPFTDEQVIALNEYQESGRFHPFTCANDGDDAHVKYEFERYQQRQVDQPRQTFEEYVEAEKEKGFKFPEIVFHSTNLIATNDGWICPVCDYKQKWAHKFMAEKPRPSAFDKFREKTSP